MNTSFNTILVPVDFTVNTEVAVKKALALCEGSSPSIHLLHVLKTKVTNLIGYYRQYYAGYSTQQQKSAINQAKEKLEKLKTFILNIKSDVFVSQRVSYGGSVETAIIEKAKEIRADLIVIGKNSHHSWLPFLNTVVPNRVSEKTGIAVLTVKPGAINQHIKIVVVPVGKKFPEKKIAVVNTLIKKFHIQIRLVTISNKQDTSDFMPASLLNTYRFLKNNQINNVRHEVLQGRNKARAILEYCENVGADLLIVNPESETRVGWLNQQISDVLPVQSKTQVLAVHPA